MERNYTSLIERATYTKNKLFLLISVFCGAFLIGIIGFMILKDLNFINALIFTIETFVLSTEKQTGAVRILQIFLMLFGVFLIWFTLWTTFDILLEGHLKKYFLEVRMVDKIKKLKNHFIICGGGRVGEHVAEMLSKERKNFVIVEKDDEMVKHLKNKKSFLILEGNALEESVLLDAGVNRAKALIAVLPETEKNILVTLTAKQLNPSLKIYARASKKEYVKTLKHAGAKYVVMPEISCAEDIIKQIS